VSWRLGFERGSCQDVKPRHLLRAGCSRALAWTELLCLGRRRTTRLRRHAATPFGRSRLRNGNGLPTVRAFGTAAREARQSALQLHCAHAASMATITADDEKLHNAPRCHSRRKPSRPHSPESAVNGRRRGEATCRNRPDLPPVARNAARGEAPARRDRESCGHARRVLDPPSLTRHPTWIADWA
jgi:hypothetical protein